MTNIIIGIIIGVVIWQLVATIIGVSTDFESELANNIMCGVWTILFYTIVKPIIFLIRKIIFHRFYSKYLKCEFIAEYEIVLTFYVDKDITKTFETLPNKNRYVRVTKANYNYIPYCGNVITKEKIEMHPEKYEYLNDWKKVD